ncbi:unnamed protein product, partial [Symbiodinium sp. CCMP2592]
MLKDILESGRLEESHLMTFMCALFSVFGADFHVLREEAEDDGFLELLRRALSTAVELATSAEDIKICQAASVLVQAVQQMILSVHPESGEFEKMLGLDWAASWSGVVFSGLPSVAAMDVQQVKDGMIAARRAGSFLEGLADGANAGDGVFRLLDAARGVLKIQDAIWKGTLQDLLRAPK